MQHAAEFITVADISELAPGDRIVVEYGKHWVAIFNIDGQFYAIEDICTHDDGPLADGELTGCVIACPRHGATFDVRTGKVLTAPALMDVSTYAIRVVDGQIQIAAR